MKTKKIKNVQQFRSTAFNLLTALFAGLGVIALVKAFININTVNPIVIVMLCLYLIAIAATYKLYHTTSITTIVSKKGITLKKQSAIPFKRKEIKLKWEDIEHLQFQQQNQWDLWAGLSVGFDSLANNFAFEASPNSMLLTTTNEQQYYVAVNEIKQLKKTIKRFFQKANNSI